MYTLIKNGTDTMEFQNLPSILDFLRDEANGQVMYVDDTEISPEDLVDHAVDKENIVTVEVDSEYIDIMIAEDE